MYFSGQVHVSFFVVVVHRSRNCRRWLQHSRPSWTTSCIVQSRGHLIMHFCSGRFGPTWKEATGAEIRRVDCHCSQSSWTTSCIAQSFGHPIMYFVVAFLGTFLHVWFVSACFGMFRHAYFFGINHVLACVGWHVLLCFGMFCVVSRVLA